MPRNGLAPRRIIDKNGKITTVWEKPSGSEMPYPSSMIPQPTFPTPLDMYPDNSNANNLLDINHRQHLELERTFDIPGGFSHQDMVDISNEYLHDKGQSVRPFGMADIWFAEKTLTNTTNLHARYLDNRGHTHNMMIPVDGNGDVWRGQIRYGRSVKSVDWDWCERINDDYIVLGCEGTFKTGEPRNVGVLKELGMSNQSIEDLAQFNGIGWVNHYRANLGYRQFTDYDFENTEWANQSGQSFTARIRVRSDRNSSRDMWVVSERHDPDDPNNLLHDDNVIAIYNSEGAALRHFDNLEPVRK